MGLRYIEYIYLDSVCFKCHITSSQCFNCCSLLFLADSNAGKFRICYLCDLGHTLDFKDKSCQCTIQNKADVWVLPGSAVASWSPLGAMAVSSDVGLGSVLWRLSKAAHACFLTSVWSNNQSPSCSTHLDEVDFSWSPRICLCLSIYLFIGSMSEKVDTVSPFVCHCRNFFCLFFPFRHLQGLVF